MIFSVYNDDFDFSYFWTRFTYFDCKRSRPGIDEKIPRKSSASLDLVAVENSRFFEQPAGTSFIEGTMEMRDEVLLKVRAEEMDKKLVQSIRFGEYQVSLGGS